MWIVKTDKRYENDPFPFWVWHSETYESDGNGKGVISYSDKEEAQKQADYLNKIRPNGFSRPKCPTTEDKA